MYHATGNIYDKLYPARVQDSTDFQAVEPKAIRNSEELKAELGHMSFADALRLIKHEESKITHPSFGTAKYFYCRAGVYLTNVDSDDVVPLTAKQVERWNFLTPEFSVWDETAASRAQSWGHQLFGTQPQAKEDGNARFW